MFACGILFAGGIFRAPEKARGGNCASRFGTIVENFAAALDEVQRLKPSSAKGRYIQKGAISTTFGPGIPLDVNAL